MGVCYYVIALDHKRAFDLDKGGWSEGLGDLLHLAARTNTAPTREEFDRALVASWCDELSVEDFEKERRLKRAWFQPAALILDAEAGVYISERQYDEEARAYAATPERALELARHDRAYALRVAARLWAFCETYGPWSNFRLINDCGDLPWWDDQWHDPFVWEDFQAGKPPAPAGPGLDLRTVKIADWREETIYSTVELNPRAALPLREREWSGWLCVDSRFNAADGAVEAAPHRLGDW